MGRVARSPDCKYLRNSTLDPDFPRLLLQSGSFPSDHACLAFIMTLFSALVYVMCDTGILRRTSSTSSSPSCNWWISSQGATATREGQISKWLAVSGGRC